MHEIDEVLGLGSAQPMPFHDDPHPEDLFRYSAHGTRSFSTAPTPQPYLSINGGSTSLVQYNTNPKGDYGDYNGIGGPHVQDAFATPGAHPTLGVELKALDVIGYDHGRHMAVRPLRLLALPSSPPSTVLKRGAR
jgi:hypothetical protein